MIIVNITRRTGLFEWVAIKAAKLAHGEPTLILVGMVLSTAVLSALLDNVTTVLLIVPAVIVIYEALELDPVPPLIFVIMASNIGGTATLVGHPLTSSARPPASPFMDTSNNGPIMLLIRPAVRNHLVAAARKQSRRSAAPAHYANGRKPGHHRPSTAQPLPANAGAGIHRIYDPWRLVSSQTIALSGPLLLMLDTHGVREPLRD